MADRAYRALGEQFAMAVALLDAELNIEWINPGGPAVLGWPPGSIVGRNAAEFIHPEDITNLLPVAHEMADFAEQSEGPAIPSAPVELPCRLQREDGDWIPMSVTGRVLDGGRNMLAVVRPSAESHAFAEVLDGLGSAAPLTHLLGRLSRLVAAQFAAERAWAVHDSDGHTEVLGCDLEDAPFDPSSVLAHLRGLDSDDWFLLVDGQLWLIPVRSAESERMFGVFVLPAPRPDGPSPWDELVARRTANLASVAFARDMRDRMLHVAATTDHLTGVLNRREFERHLESDGDAMPMTLFFLDLDDFKEVNDDFGHGVGDAVLATVARRLQGVVRSRDRVGRLGGDEFVVSCPDLDPDDVEATRLRIASVVGEPVVVDGLELSVTASVGVARAKGAAQVESLVNRSDADMFERKRRLKDGFSDLSPEVNG